MNNPLTPPSPATHDTSRSSYHISDISVFAESLQDAANKAFPNRGRSRYHTVNVCLIRWEEDELEVQHEINHLIHVFSEWYGFNTEIWLIPSVASQIQLTRKTCDFLQKFDAEGNLFVVYYGGHGKISAARQNQWWCRSDQNSPFVDWTSIQTLFSTAVSDVLVLLDCCAAASSASGIGSNTMETIAACGFETTAPSPSERSFTYTLIEVLEEWVDKPSFSVAMLHTEILFILKQKRPERGLDGRRWETCSTPVHWVCTGDSKAPGIEIASVRTSNTAGKLPELQSKPTTYVDAMELDDDNSEQNPLNATRPNGDYKVPHVLIAIALEEDQETLDALACRRWLLSFPALVKYATVEGVYRGYSTMVTLSVPVMIWDNLPAHPACSFVGYVISPNRYKQSASVETETLLVREALFTSRHRRIHRPSKLRSCDSSYGSEGSDSENALLCSGGLESWEMPSSDADDDDSEPEEVYIKPVVGKGNLIRGSTKPIDICIKGSSNTKHYHSPEQIIQSLKSWISRLVLDSVCLKPEVEEGRCPRSRTVDEMNGNVQRKRSSSI